jgi:glycosyltransferase involved in cell wall biosynthesis
VVLLTENLEKRRVLVEPTGKLHSAIKEIILHPPEGYEFIYEPKSLEKAILSIIFDTPPTNKIFETIKNKGAVPFHLYKRYFTWNRNPKQTPYDLTFSIGHIITRNEPWVVELEWVTQLTGFWLRRLLEHKKEIQRYLSSDNCRKIICMTELTKKTVLTQLDAEEIRNKVTTVYRTVRPKKITRNYQRKDCINILFSGSGNLKGEFANEKGGIEFIRMAEIVAKRYDKVKFIIRSDVPKWVFEKCRQIRNVYIIPEVLPWEAYERLFLWADIFVLPAHHTPSLAFLDAMSYELPVVTINSWANAEIVEHRRTGLVVSLPKAYQYPVADFLPDYKFPVRRERIVCEDTVNGLADSVTELIEDEELRIRLGKAGRWEVEKGKFSIEKRNHVLKNILDEACK